MSKFMDMFDKGAEVNYKVLCGIGQVLKWTAEAVVEIIQNPCSGQGQPQFGQFYIRWSIEN